MSDVTAFPFSHIQQCSQYSETAECIRTDSRQTILSEQMSKHFLNIYDICLLLPFLMDGGVGANR